MSFFVQNPTYKLVFSKVLIREHSYLILENLHIHFAKFLVYLVAINITILVRFYPLFDPTKRLVLGEKFNCNEQRFSPFEKVMIKARQSNVELYVSLKSNI